MEDRKIADCLRMASMPLSSGQDPTASTRSHSALSGSYLLSFSFLRSPSTARFCGLTHLAEGLQCAWNGGSVRDDVIVEPDVGGEFTLQARMCSYVPHAIPMGE